MLRNRLPKDEISGALFSNVAGKLGNDPLFFRQLLTVSICLSLKSAAVIAPITMPKAFYISALPVSCRLQLFLPLPSKAIQMLSTQSEYDDKLLLLSTLDMDVTV